MTPKILSGKDFLEDEKARLKIRVEKLKNDGIEPGLGTILVGSDLNSQSYVRRKHKACEEVGMTSHHIELDDNATQAQVIAAIELMNANPKINAFIVQLPLPKQCDEEQALLAIDPKKDADGRGYATEALHLIVDYAFEVLDLHQIYSNVRVENESSVALFKKVGFEVTGLKQDWM